MSTIQTLNNESHATIRSKINGNFANLNTDKLEAANIATKANMVAGATAGNFASLNSGGDLQDSGHKHSDYAAAVHTHAASDIVSGIVAQARLGSGSDGSGNHFLADDQTYKTIVLAMPSGVIMQFGGSSAPTGYVLCDGSAISRTTYSALYAVIGTTYGTGDGSTTFNVPDMRGRVAVGVGTGTGGGASGTGLPTGGSALTAVSRGTWKGEETHALTSGENGPHTHVQNAGTGGNAQSMSATVGATSDVATNSNTGSSGSGTPHNNIQPVMGLNFIIKT